MTLYQWKTQPDLLEESLLVFTSRQKALSAVPEILDVCMQLYQQLGINIERSHIYFEHQELMLRQSIFNVFKYADTESPSEAIFLNMLLIIGLIECSPGLIVTPPLTSEQRAKRKQRYLRSIDLFNNDKKCDQILERKLQEFAALPQAKNDKTFTKKKLDQFLIHWSLEESRLSSYHCTPQDEFPEIEIDGSSIRPDILIWKPDDANVKVIVECDGYDVHYDPNEKRLRHFSTFIKDRKRDRRLQDLGYCVRRYSGSEIKNTPAESAVDLISFLQQNPVLTFST